MQTTGTERLRADLKQAATPQMKAEDKFQAIFQSSLDVLLIIDGGTKPSRPRRHRLLACNRPRKPTHNGLKM